MNRTSLRRFLAPLAIGLWLAPGAIRESAAQDSTILLPPAPPPESAPPAADPNAGVTIDWGAITPGTPSAPADTASPAANSAPTPPPGPEAMPDHVLSPSEMMSAPAPQNPAPVATPPALPTAEDTAILAPDATPVLPEGTVSAITANSLTIDYPPRQDEVPVAARPALDQLVANLVADSSLKLQILATASGSEEEAAKAQRKSLARALAIRSYLYRAGIAADRLEIHALGLGIAPVEAPVEAPAEGAAAADPAAAPPPADPLANLPPVAGGDSVLIVVVGS